MDKEITMDELSGMTEREAIAYRRGFDDGLAAMREKIKGLLLENDRLRRPLLDRPHPPVASRDVADSRVCFLSGGEVSPQSVCADNGRGQR
jgi:hypothetical protein